MRAPDALTALDERLARSVGLESADRIWASVRRTAFVLWTTRASLFVMILTIGVFFSDQVSDAMVQLSESHSWIAWVFFFALEAVWGFMIAYGARTILMFDMGVLRGRGLDARGELGRHFKWWPRIYALAGPAGIGLAQYLSASTQDRELKQMALVSVAIGVLLFALMTFRRRLFRLRTKEPPLQPIFVASAARNRGVEEPVRKLAASELTNFLIAAICLTAAWMLFVLIAAYSPRWLLEFSSSPALVFLILASWLPGLILLAFLSHWRAFPFFVGWLVLAVAMSYVLPDHHSVQLRSPSDEAHPATAERLDLTAAVKRWKAANPTSERPIVVAAAGGGIRAAFWTATVLGAIEDCTHNFSQRTFAISGVSGGSIGAATYGALLNASSGAAPTCAGQARSSYVDGNQGTLSGFRVCGQSVLSHNLLSAPLLALAYKDVLLGTVRLNFLFGLQDRAAAIEGALQAGWSATLGEDSPGFDLSFLEAGPHQASSGWRPALVFNATSVLTGGRVVASSVDLESDFPPELHDMLKHAGLPRSDLSLASAAFLSARFPIISPAGSIVTFDSKDSKPTLRARVVDGGYFENFGAETAQDLYFALRNKGLDPIVIQISSDPDLPAPDDDTPAFERERGPLTGGVVGVFTPMSAVLKARTARGAQSSDSLRRTVNAVGKTDSPSYFHLRLIKGENLASAPLGWVLSKRSQGTLNGQLLQDYNRSQLEQIIGVLSPEQDASSCVAEWSPIPFGS